MAKKTKHDDAAADRKMIKAELAKRGLKNGGRVKAKARKR